MWCQERTHDAYDASIAFTKVGENTAPLSYKDNPQRLPHLWAPPGKSRTPSTDKVNGAAKEDRLPGAIESENRLAAVCTQPRTCDHCGTAFEPRTRSGGKAQRFCSPACRKAFHRTYVNVSNVRKDVGRDVGALVPNTPLAPPARRPSHRQLRAEAHVSVYRNKRNDIVLRQRADGDQYVRLRPEKLPLLVQRLQELQQRIEKEDTS